MSFEPLKTPTGEELIYDVEMAKWATIPCTCGMEIEQYEYDIRRCSRIRSEYDWHYDASGPLETALPPSIAPYENIKKFIQLVVEEGCYWEWKGFFTVYGSEYGCGSHIHLRPRPSKLHQQEDLMKPQEKRIPFLQDDPPYDHPRYVTIYDVWSTAHNTLIEIYPFILPLFCAGAPNVFRFRVSAVDWASLNYRRYSPSEMREYYLNPYYRGHPFEAVAMNRKGYDKPLTFELRLNEAHPASAYLIIVICNRIIRRCYERGYLPPKIVAPSGARDELYISLRDAIRVSARENRDLYEELEKAVEGWVRKYGPIRFEPEIPRLKKQYDSYFKIFKDILYQYTHWMNPFEYRMYQLYANKGNPRRNWKEMWFVMLTPKGEFSWREPYIPNL